MFTRDDGAGDGGAGDGGAATVARIICYPVKGLPGAPVCTAELTPGSGLKFDRRFGIVNGTRPLPAPDGWNPRNLYFHVARSGHLVRFRTELSEPDGPGAETLTIIPPDAVPITLRLEDPEALAADLEHAGAALGKVLPAGKAGPVSLVNATTGLWDWPDAPLSIINLTSVQALAEAAGRPVDPRRFRANLYISGLPAWEEFSYLGRQIDVGGVRLEVFQPTDRCRATTIDPESGESDLNVPALLAGEFGHRYCGVYARVVSGGRISVGDHLAHPAGASDSRPVSAPSVAGLPVSAPPVSALPMPARPTPRLADGEAPWPRVAQIAPVTDREAGAEAWLTDSSGLARSARPGQLIRLHPAGTRSTGWSSCRIMEIDEDRVRIRLPADGDATWLVHPEQSSPASVLISGPLNARAASAP